MANKEDNLVPFTSENAAEMGRKGGKNKKGRKHISTYIQEMLEDESFQTWLADPKKGWVEYKGMPMKAIVATATIKAMNGDKDAREWLAKYGYGMKLSLVLEDPVQEALEKLNLIEGESAGETKEPESKAS